MKHEVLVTYLWLLSWPLIWTVAQLKTTETLALRKKGFNTGCWMLTNSLPVWKTRSFSWFQPTSQNWICREPSVLLLYPEGPWGVLIGIWGLGSPCQFAAAPRYLSWNPEVWWLLLAQSQTMPVRSLSARHIPCISSLHLRRFWTSSWSSWGRLISETWKIFRNSSLNRFWEIHAF